MANADPNVFDDALELPVESRAELANKLLASLNEGEEQDEAEVIAAWADEAIRRSEAARRGEIETIAGDEVFRDQPSGKKQ